MIAAQCETILKLLLKSICHQKTNQSQQTNGQTRVIQEVVSPEVSKLNHVVMNKKQGDQMLFSLEKED